MIFILIWQVNQGCFYECRTSKVLLLMRATYLITKYNIHTQNSLDSDGLENRLMTMLKTVQHSSLHMRRIIQHSRTFEKQKEEFCPVENFKRLLSYFTTTFPYTVTVHVVLTVLTSFTDYSSLHIHLLKL